MQPLSTYQKLLVIGLFAGAVFFSLFHLTESPPFNSDEGWYVQTATNLVTTGIDGLQMAPGYIQHFSTYTSVGYPFMYPLALWFKIFGIGILQARLLMVLFLIGFTILGYLLSRRLFGNNISIAVLALLVTFPPLYGNGKAVMGEMPGLFFMALSLFFFSSIRVSPSSKVFWLILSGVAAGLFVATKASFILFIPALFVAAIIEWRRGGLSMKELCIACASLVIPVIIWLLAKFQPGDTLSVVLGFYANPSNVANVSGTIAKNIRALFTDVSTLYTMSLVGVWLVGIFLRLRAKSRIAFEEIVAFIFALLTIASFVRTAGFYRYLLPTQLAALIFFPYSFKVVLEYLAGKMKVFAKPLLFTGIISILVVFGLYQLSFRSYVADAYKSHASANIQAYFDTIPATTSVFFYSSQGVVPFFHGKDYYQYLILFNQENWTVGSEWLPVLKSGQVDMVVAGPHSAKDDKNGVFDKYVTVKTFDKLTIMKHK